MIISIKNIVLVSASVLFTTLLFVLLMPRLVVNGAPLTATNIGYTATTSTSYSVVASTRVLATTTNALGAGTSYTRVWATICNPSASVVFLNMNADAPAKAPSSTVAQIAAAAGYNSCFEITDRNQYLGSVQASSTVTGPTTIYVTEYVQ